MKTGRVKVVGTGLQSPYGIGETIVDFPDTPAGIKKAMRSAAYWYNAARVIGSDGERIEIDYDQVRKRDLGYSIE